MTPSQVSALQESVNSVAVPAPNGDGLPRPLDDVHLPRVLLDRQRGMNWMRSQYGWCRLRTARCWRHADCHQNLDTAPCESGSWCASDSEGKDRQTDAPVRRDGKHSLLWIPGPEATKTSAKVSCALLLIAVPLSAGLMCSGGARRPAARTLFAEHRLTKRTEVCTPAGAEIRSA